MEATSKGLRIAGGLSGTALKTIALALMVLDHIHEFFSFTGYIPQWFSMLGRLAAPLFLFCLVEGFAHTHNRKRYFFKVYLLSVGMNGLLFFIMYARILVRPDGFIPMNGMMTAFAVLMMVWQGIDWLEQKKWGWGLAAAILPLIWPFLVAQLFLHFPNHHTLLGLVEYTIIPTWNTNPDAYIGTILSGLVLYLFRRRRVLQVFLFAAVNFLFSFVYLGSALSGLPDFHWSQMFTDYYEWYGIFAAGLMLCYNGQRGKGYQQFFYIFYPAHIYLLYALSWGLCLLLK